MTYIKTNFVQQVYRMHLGRRAYSTEEAYKQPNWFPCPVLYASNKKDQHSGNPNHAISELYTCNPDHAILGSHTLPNLALLKLISVCFLSEFCEEILSGFSSTIWHKYTFSKFKWDVVYSIATIWIFPLHVCIW